MSKINGAQSLVNALEAAGVEVMFGIPGGAILPAYDPIFDSKIRHILVRHEQGAGHAATGYAQATGKVGVCIATSGPGATNLVTPLADAQMDSVPIVAITGQVPGPAIGTDAFQEADIRGVTMPVTKHNYLITDPADIPRAIAEAFHIASTGRPGAVLVDIAKDALQKETTFNYPKNVSLAGYNPVMEPKSEAISDAAALISQSKKPVLYVGGGVIKANAAKELLALAEAMGCVGLRCETPGDVDKTIEAAMAINDRPVVVDFNVHRDAMVWPMVAAGTSNDDITVARSMAPVWDSQEL